MNFGKIENAYTIVNIEPDRLELIARWIEKERPIVCDLNGRTMRLTRLSKYSRDWRGLLVSAELVSGKPWISWSHGGWVEDTTNLFPLPFIFWSAEQRAEIENLVKVLA